MVESVEYGHSSYRLSGLSTNMLSTEQTFPPDFFNQPIKIRSVVRLFVSTNKINDYNSISARTGSSTRHSVASSPNSECRNILSHFRFSAKDTFFFGLSHSCVITRQFYFCTNRRVGFLFIL